MNKPNKAIATGLILVASAFAGTAITNITGGPTLYSPGGTATVVAVTSNATDPVVFTSTTTSVCTAGGTNGATITIVTAGSCSIKATQVASGDTSTYTKAFTIAKATQTVADISNLPTKYKDTTTVTTTSSVGLTPITYSSLTTTKCSVILPNKVAAKDTGTCQIKAIQAGNTNYLPDTTITSQVIGKGTQVIKKPRVTVSISYKDTVSITTTSTSALTSFTYATSTPSVCSFNNTTNKLNALAAGSCTFKAHQAGNNVWSADSSADTTVVIGKRAQTVGTLTTASTVEYLDTVAMRATATSGLAVTFTSTTPTICTVENDSLVAAKATGSCIITTAQAGNDNWASTTKNQTITINKRPQTISAVTGGPSKYGDSTQVSATATSGLTITYTSNSATVCKVYGSYIVAILSGKCIITASQAGNTNWSAATSVKDTMTIAKLPIKLLPVAKTKIYGSPDSLKYIIDTTGSPGDSLIRKDVLSGTLSRAAGENVGQYLITRGTITDAANLKYAITFVDTVKLTISKKPITVTANAYTKLYGAADPTTFAYKAVTLKTGDVLKGKLSRDAGDSVGVYDIKQGTLINDSNPNYDITYTKATLTISRKPITITANAQTKVYGEDDPEEFTYVISPVITGLDSLKGLLTRDSGDSVGNYPIRQGTLDSTNNPNYAIKFVTKNLVITQRPITITATARTKVYGQDDSLKYTMSASPDSLITGDTLTGALSRKAGLNVGSYPILKGTLNNKNYKITFVADTLKITRKEITVVARDTTKVYGSKDPIFKYDATGLVGKDVLKGVLKRDTGSYVDTFDILQGTVNDSLNKNYSIEFTPAKLVITKKPITVVADSLVKLYGDTTCNNLTYKATGLVGKDLLKGALVRDTGRVIGTYAITQGTLVNDSNPNYTITFTPRHLVIKPKPLTITPAAKSYVYGDTLAQDTTLLTFTTSTLAYSDSFSDPAKGWLSRKPGTKVGVYAINIGGIKDSNYKFSLVARSLTITKKPLGIKADRKNLTYGQPISISYTISEDEDSSLVGSDTLTGALARKSGNGAGVYPISKGTLNNSNYLITFTPDTLFIARKNLSVKTKSLTKVYGAANPSYVLIGDSLVGTDKVLGLPVREVGDTVGVYEIGQGTVDSIRNPNYNITFDTDSTFTITKRPVKVTPNALSKIYGAADPAVLTYTASGLYGKDKLKGALVRDTGENKFDKYEIKQGTLVNDSNPNYEITFVTGKYFKISPKALKITLGAFERTTEQSNPDFFASPTVITGLVGSDTIAGAFSVAMGTTPTGKKLISAGTVTSTNNPNYTVTVVTNYLTITAVLAKYAKFGESLDNSSLTMKPAPELLVEGKTSVYDLRGQLVWSGVVQAGQFKMLMGSDLKKGRYIVKNRVSGNFVWNK